MTDEQRGYFKRRLEQERERVIAALARFGERVVSADRRAEESSGVPSQKMHESDSYNQALDALELSRLTRELAEIDDAMKVLQEAPDRYGLDKQTGEPIPFDLLDKTPWALTALRHEDASHLLAADPDVLRAYRNERYAG